MHFGPLGCYGSIAWANVWNVTIFVLAHAYGNSRVAYSARIVIDTHTQTHTDIHMKTTVTLGVHAC